jgi:hypothetical protein
MTIKELVKFIVEKEGKKKEVSVGDVREIIAILSEVLATEDGQIGRVETYSNLVKNGKRRLKK